MKIAMTIKVRDEADIIADNLRYHAAQGVDFFVIAEHASVDPTREVLAPFVDAGLVHLVDVDEDDVLELTRRQMTRLAGIAAELGADWIIHNDADEFWWPVAGDLRDVFSAIPEEFGLLIAPRAEFIPRPGEAPWPERLLYREARALRRPKIAHRPHPRLHLHGVHPSSLWVEPPPTAVPTESGPPKLRMTPGEQEREVELVLAPRFPVRCLHFPLRSFDHYVQRIDIALRTEKIWGERGRRMAEAREQGKLAEVYDHLLVGEDELAEALESGRLVKDGDFAAYLRACPDPLVGGTAPPGARGWSDQRRREELIRLETDAMHSISRRLQQTAKDAERRKRRRREQAQG
ncbi:MAG: glycosyltransferase family 2 protein [Actinomycetota bacterium]|nr:glycosyltransferase family 2 protein [Actinomycetota bacterium]